MRDQKFFLTLDPGWKKFAPGMRDKHPGSATPLRRVLYIKEPDPDLNFFLDPDLELRYLVQTKVTIPGKYRSTLHL
jgi:hypothetical protein